LAKGGSLLMTIKKTRGTPIKRGGDCVYESVRSLNQDLPPRTERRTYGKIPADKVERIHPFVNARAAAAEPEVPVGRQRDMRPELRASAERVWANNAAAFRYLADR